MTYAASTDDGGSDGWSGGWVCGAGRRARAVPRSTDAALLTWQYSGRAKAQPLSSQVARDGGSLSVSLYALHSQFSLPTFTYSALLCLAMKAKANDSRSSAAKERRRINNKVRVRLSYRRCFGRCSLRLSPGCRSAFTTKEERAARIASANSRQGLERECLTSPPS